MKFIPLNPLDLTHQVEWITKTTSISTPKETKTIIDRVHIRNSYIRIKFQPQETTFTDFVMYWDNHYSTKIDGKAPNFAVGDNIRFIKGPINDWLKLLVIKNVKIFTNPDGTPHHLEIYLGY